MKRNSLQNNVLFFLVFLSGTKAKHLNWFLPDCTHRNMMISIVLVANFKYLAGEPTSQLREKETIGIIKLRITNNSNT